MLDNNLEFEFNLEIKGFINIDGTNSDLDLHVWNTEVKDEKNESHKCLLNKLSLEATEAKKAGLPVSYDIKIKGYFMIVGIKIEIEKEFKSEDINKA